MTHFQPQRDASQREDEGQGQETGAALQPVWRRISPYARLAETVLPKMPAEGVCAAPG